MRQPIVVTRPWRLQDRPLADVHQRERAGAVRALRVPLVEARLPEEREAC